MGCQCRENPFIDSLCVATLLLGVDVPDNVVGETNDLVTGALGHLGETLGLGLVLESVAGEVDAYGCLLAGASLEYAP